MHGSVNLEPSKTLVSVNWKNTGLNNSVESLVRQIQSPSKSTGCNSQTICSRTGRHATLVESKS